MEHSFHLRPSDSFVVGSTKITLASIKSSRLVTLTVTAGDRTTKVALALGAPFTPEPAVSIALDPNTSRPSRNAILVVSAPDSLPVQPPQ
jgi:hypothetical protein